MYTLQVWTLDRSAFQGIMLNTGILRQSEQLSFLKRCLCFAIVLGNVFFHPVLCSSQCARVQEPHGQGSPQDSRCSTRGIRNKCAACVMHVLPYFIQDYYPAGEYIIRQGATGDTFFIINEGTVSLTRLIKLRGLSMFARPCRYG